MTSEWFFACSQGGTSKYPYGDELEAGTCLDKTLVDAQGDVAFSTRDTSGSTCHGTMSPYDEVHNMSGSVEQWVNICRTSGCFTSGGRWYDQALACGDERLGVPSRASKYFARGVRCCADAVPNTDSNP
jgi:formylglycine-generating enzyme required for sulfatase activity